MADISNKQWTKVIDSRQRWLNFEILEDVWHYRDLISMFVQRDISVIYKQSILGPVWYFIQPLFTTVVHSFIFGNLADISTGGIPHVLFYFSGTMLWTFFSTVLLATSTCFIDNSGVFTKIYFPRLCVPISILLTNAVKLFFQFICLMIFFLYYLLATDILKPSPMMLISPLLILWIGMSALGLGLIATSLTTKYRDLRHLITFALPLAMYATPVVYPLARGISSKFSVLYYINPVSAPFEYFRVWYFGIGEVPMDMTLISLASSLALFVVGMICFTHSEKNFVDVV